MTPDAGPELSELVAEMPFAAGLGIELERAEPGEVAGPLPRRVGHVTGVARPLRVGRSVIVVSTELSGAAGRPVAHTTQAQAVITP